LITAEKSSWLTTKMMRGVTQNGLWLNVFDNDFIIEDIKNETMLTL